MGRVGFAHTAVQVKRKPELGNLVFRYLVRLKWLPIEPTRQTATAQGGTQESARIDSTDNGLWIQGEILLDSALRLDPIHDHLPMPAHHPLVVPERRRGECSLAAPPPERALTDTEHRGDGLGSEEDGRLGGFLRVLHSPIPFVLADDRQIASA